MVGLYCFFVLHSTRKPIGRLKRATIRPQNKEVLTSGFNFTILECKQHMFEKQEKTCRILFKFNLRFFSAGRWKCIKTQEGWQPKLNIPTNCLSHPTAEWIDLGAGNNLVTTLWSRPLYKMNFVSGQEVYLPCRNLDYKAQKLTCCPLSIFTESMVHERP